MQVDKRDSSAPIYRGSHVSSHVDILQSITIPMRQKLFASTEMVLNALISFINKAPKHLW